MRDKNFFLAPGKLNLFLRVVGRRKDGFHFIRSGVTFINLFDIITIEKSLTTNIYYKGLFKPKNGFYNDCIIKRTLIFLGLNNKINFNITIKKNIPVKGGLGSASTNAATLIMALAEMNIIKLKDPKYYISLGSDVPCFLFKKNCLITGIGDNIFYEPFPKYFFLIVKPNFDNSTKDMYDKLDLKLKFSNNPEILDKTEIDEDDIGNDFEKIIFDNNNKYNEIIEFINNTHKVIFSRITGSGSCYYAVYDDKINALNAQKIFNKKFPSLWTVVSENNL